MEYSADSLRYLHIAYAIFIIILFAHAVWLAYRWSRVQAETRSLTSRKVD